MDVTKELTAYYSTYDEDGRLRSRHGMVEYLTTMRYIAKYLRPGMRILEIGAGTGRYSHALAQQGYRVDAVELVQHNYVGTDMATNYMRQEIDDMDDDFFRQYLQYHFSICERGDLLGASHHILDVFRKNDENVLAKSK